jgi:tetratricopeptide (TPR) repeat protein
MHWFWVNSVGHTHWFSDWQGKDWITLVASASALVISLISYRQKATESKLALRKQLTDTMKEITDVNMKEATYRTAEKKEAYPATYPGLLADQRRYLVRQAASLADSLGDLVNSYERVMIANTFDTLDYVEEAARFFKSAVETKQGNVEKGLALRAYGRFLFRQGMSREGAQRYRYSIEAFAGDDDRFRYYRGDTYLRFAEQEFNVNQDVVQVRLLLDQARKEFGDFKNKNRKTSELKRVDEGVKKMLENRPW